VALDKMVEIGSSHLEEIDMEISVSESGPWHAGGRLSRAY
jgi:hypothetical protein